MKSLAILFCLSISAHASPATDFVAAYPALGELARAGGAMEICEGWLKMPVEAYAREVRATGQAWSTAQEPVEYLLDTCNGMWGAREAAPVALRDTKRGQKIAAYDLVEIGRAALPVRIRAFLDGKPAGGTRPAPYEILYGMAASQREVDLAVTRGVSASKATLLALGGSTFAEALLATGTAARTASAYSFAASRTGFQAALAIGVLSAAISLGADYGAWWSDERAHWARIDALASRLAALRPDENPAPLLRGYVEAVERLGHFYNYELYLSQSGQDLHPTAAGRCGTKLARFFAAPEANDWGVKMTRHTICKDAAAVWAGASQFLRRFSGSAEAARQTDGLMARAKRTYTIYLESAAYESTLPLCTPTGRGSIVNFEIECRDRATGAQVL